MNEWLDFLGWYVAEGCSDIKRAMISVAHNTIDDNKERNIIKRAIERLGYKIKFTKDALRIYDTQLKNWLLKNCGHLAKNKKVPDFIKKLDKEQIFIFLKSLYQGDGHKSKTAHTLYTVSKQLCDDVQELILKVGDASSYIIVPPKISKNIIGKNECFCINWIKKSNYHNTQNKGMSPSSIEELVDYSGNVYCVTVPNNVIYVRREGIPVWCGNSLRFYFDGGDETVSGMVHLAEHMSGKICESCGSTKKVSQTGGWIKTLCSKCMKNLKADYLKEEEL